MNRSTVAQQFMNKFVIKWLLNASVCNLLMRCHPTLICRSSCVLYGLIICFIPSRLYDTNSHASELVCCWPSSSHNDSVNRSVSHPADEQIAGWLAETYSTICHQQMINWHIVSTAVKQLVAQNVPSWNSGSNASIHGSRYKCSSNFTQPTAQCWIRRC